MYQDPIDNNQDERSSAYSEFVGSLDKWLNFVARRGRSEQEIIDAVRAGIKQNIEANIEYYSKMQDEALTRSDDVDANRFKVLETVYRQLCKP